MTSYMTGINDLCNNTLIVDHVIQVTWFDFDEMWGFEYSRIFWISDPYIRYSIKCGLKVILPCRFFFYFVIHWVKIFDFRSTSAQLGRFTWHHDVTRDKSKWPQNDLTCFWLKIKLAIEIEIWMTHKYDSLKSTRQKVLRHY